MIFTTAQYTYLGDEISQISGLPVGEIERSTFPDGERYRRILSSVINRDVVLVGGTVSDTETLELYDLGCALVKYGARSLTLVVPYFGYSTMERETKPGEVLPAKTRARLLSVIPWSPLGNRIILLDVHTPSLPHYLEGNLRHIALTTEDLTISVARRLGGNSYIMAAPDAGRAKMVESLAEKLNVPAVYLFKKRLSGEKTEVKAVSGDVEGQKVILSDDMIRSGSSLVEAAKILRAQGAHEIYAMATHGLFPGDAVAKLEATKLFEKIIVTNSHPRTREVAGSLIEVVSIAPLIAQTLAAQTLKVPAAQG